MALALFGSEDEQKDPVSTFVSYFKLALQINFMLDYIKAHFGNRPSVNEGERHELDFLRDECKKLKDELSKYQGEGGKSTASDGHSSEDSEDEEGDQVEELQAKPTASLGKTGPRMSVSAEVFGKFNIEKEYIPPVHKKSPEDMQAIKSRMAQNFMFNSLNPKDEKAILLAVVPVTKQKGDVIIQEGDDGDNFYLLERGALDCTKVLKEGEAPTFLKEYAPGESFGELALLYNAPRAATITCKSEDCLLWSMDRNTFNAIIKTAVQKKREKYDQFLDKVEILKCMQKNERSKLADAFKEEWFEDTDYIIKQGDKDDNSSFYMIIEGDCIATMVMQPGTPAQQVKEYGPGDYFGERSLLKDLPRAANVIAKS